MGIWSDSPKTSVDFSKSTSKEPVTVEQLAEVEKNILKVLDELADKIHAREAEEKENPKKD